MEQTDKTPALQIAIGSSEEDVYLWCERIQECDDGTWKYRVINGDWHVFVDMEMGAVCKPLRVIGELVVWEGKAPFAHHEYNEALAWINQQIRPQDRPKPLPTASYAETTGEVIGYMCMIDWEHEIGASADGNRVFPSVEALKARHTCADECGIVEVEVRIKRVVQEAREDASKD